MPYETLAIRTNYQIAIENLRQSGGCSCRCEISLKVTDDPAAFVFHNGVTVEIPVGDLSDVNYDAWADINQQWRTRASDLHRYEAMQSEWPVF